MAGNLETEIQLVGLSSHFELARRILEEVSGGRNCIQFSIGKGPALRVAFTSEHNESDVEEAALDIWGDYQAHLRGKQLVAA